MLGLVSPLMYVSSPSIRSFYAGVLTVILVDKMLESDEKNFFASISFFPPTEFTRLCSTD